jgi:protoheme IX farnesyltransferase
LDNPPRELVLDPPRALSFGRARDLIELAKPRITALVVFTAALGLLLAPGVPPLGRAVPFLIATAGLVAAANTLNCWLESDVDGRMRRTRNRPLPAGRLTPAVALALGLVEAAVSLALLAATTNLLTLLLGLVAVISYVAVYTPLKRLRWWAVVVGALPGALPPLMGWTAATGRLGAPGWLAFGILFCWQLPHFVAIALCHKDDYARGGLQVLPVVHGDAVARWHLFAYTALLVAVSLLAVPLEVAGWAYVSTAALLGAGFLAVGAAGLGAGASNVWARRAFLYSLAYLPALIAVLVLDARP